MTQHMPQRDSVLVIMPVGSDPDYLVKKAAIDRAVTRSGMQAVFPRYEPEDPRFKASEFGDQLRRTTTVVADLTGERPSCYFELGYAEALERPVRLFAQIGTPIHQSGFRQAVSFYANLEQLEEAITRALTPAVSIDCEPD